MSSELFRDRRVLWMPLDVPWKPPTRAVTRCCHAMQAALAFACEQHADPFECADALVIYNEIFDEYGLAVHDGGASYVLIANCPWCGATLPASQRDRWFDETDALEAGVELPDKYRSGDWRR